MSAFWVLRRWLASDHRRLLKRLTSGRPIASDIAHSGTAKPRWQVFTVQQFGVQ
jgi:hypothetical protein